MSEDRKTRETIVLIHGLGRTRVSMMPLALRLQRAGFRTVFTRYSSMRMTLREATDSVARQVERLAARRGGPLSLVGHSLGGIIALRLKRERSDLPIHRVVQLGSPNHGSQMAEILKDSALATWFFGPVLAELSEDLTNAATRDPDVAAIAGVGAPSGIVRVFGVTEPSDGLVTEGSAWGNEASVRLSAPTIHTGLPLSRSVADATVAFLKTGHAEIADG